MNKLSVLLIVAVCIVGVVKTAETNNKYNSKYDSIDVDRILGNERVLTSYIKCAMEEGPCTPDGRELKKILPDALATECSKCNEKQKTTAEKVFKVLTERRPRDWERLTKKYDPQGVYQKRYEELAKQKKI